MTPKQPRAQLSKSGDWVTNLSMQSTYTANLSKICTIFDISLEKLDQIDIYCRPVDIFASFIDTFRIDMSISRTDL